MRSKIIDGVGLHKSSDRLIGGEMKVDTLAVIQIPDQSRGQKQQATQMMYFFKPGPPSVLQ